MKGAFVPAAIYMDEISKVKIRITKPTTSFNNDKCFFLENFRSIIETIFFIRRLEPIIARQDAHTNSLSTTITRSRPIQCVNPPEETA
jgi:hypothetical protein